MTAISEIMTAISDSLTAISNFLIVVGNGRQPLAVALFLGGLGGVWFIGLMSIGRAGNPPHRT